MEAALSMATTQEAAIALEAREAHDFSPLPMPNALSVTVPAGSSSDELDPVLESLFTASGVPAVSWELIGGKRQTPYGTLQRSHWFRHYSSGQSHGSFTQRRSLAESGASAR